MSERDTENLLTIIDSCSKIEKFTDEIWGFDQFHENIVVFDAVLMNFIVIGESVSRLSGFQINSKMNTRK